MRTPAVVRTTINVAHGLNLAGSEAVIAIRSNRTHPVPEIYTAGSKLHPWRIVDDAVADAVVGVALRQDRVAQDFHLVRLSGTPSPSLSKARLPARLSAKTAAPSICA